MPKPDYKDGWNYTGGNFGGDVTPGAHDIYLVLMITAFNV
jgi:hypothetical protein